MAATNKIVLGTAQFGLPYGIANKSGVMSESQVGETIGIARTYGIRVLDTAVGYGSSESLLGKLGIGDFKILTKLPPIPADCKNVGGWVEHQVAGSLERLQVGSLHGLSLHRPGQILEEWGDELYQSMHALKQQGLVERIGISIYHPDELEPLLERRAFDMVQAPFSVLDRRLIGSGWLRELEGRGCELHARSIFLQGLLLMSYAERPMYFHRWDSLLTEWDDWLRESGLSPVQACLRYALRQTGVTRVLVGVDGPRQLEQILDAAAGELPHLPDRLSSFDPDLLNPSRWPQT